MFRSFSRLIFIGLLGLVPLCSFGQKVPLFLVETSHATHSGPTKPELGFLIKDDAGTFIIKNEPRASFSDTLLRVNPLGLPPGQTFSTRTLKGTYQSYPSVSELIAGRDTKNTKAFDAGTRLSRARSRDFLNSVAFFCRNVLIGAETMPYTKFNDIDGTYQSWQFTNSARQFSEAQFGTLLEGLLLGHMTLGESQTHVMNIIGIDDDRLSLATWAREYEGTIKELAAMDRRGPVLAPTIFEQFPIVARNTEGRVVIPSLAPDPSLKLSAPQLKAVERFNLGPAGKRSGNSGSK